MRKIIITIIATFFLIANVENVKGFTDRPHDMVNHTYSISSSVPVTNIATGVQGKISLERIGPFIPFVKGGAHMRILRESFIEGSKIEPARFGWPINEWLFKRQGRIYFEKPAFSPVFNIELGSDLRITDRNFLRASAGLSIGQGFRGNSFSAGYIHRVPLSSRTSLDLGAMYKRNTEALMARHEVREFWPDIDKGLVYTRDLEYFPSQFIADRFSIQAELKHSIRPNLQLVAGVSFSRKIQEGRENRERGRGVTGERTTGIESPADGNMSQNLIKFNAGIQLRIPVNDFQLDWQPRPPRQRVAPHQRALPCPPGQMRHLRSWDRPSSVFNHPSGR